MSAEPEVKIVYVTIKSGYTEAQKRASKKYYEAHKQEVIDKVKARYQERREELNEKAKARYHRKQEELKRLQRESSSLPDIAAIEPASA